jgi:hypothetical protein
LGRRGGKSHAAALCAVYEAAFQDHRDRLAPGEVATVMLVAADRQQARTLLRHVKGLCDHPMIRPMVLRETESGTELSNRSVIEVATASHRAVRGYTCAAVICDEIAFWFSDGARPDVEVSRPCVLPLRPLAESWWRCHRLMPGAGCFGTLTGAATGNRAGWWWRRRHPGP